MNTYVNAPGTFRTESLSKALGEKQSEINTKKAEYQAFIDMINANNEIPQEVQKKYIESTRILIARLTGYLSQIEEAIPNILKINDLNDSIQTQSDALTELNRTNEEKINQLKRLMQELNKLEEESKV